MLKKLIFIFTIIIVYSCQTVKTQDQKQQISYTNAELGTIGSTNYSILGSNFNQIGVPKLAKKIRVQVTQIPFNKFTYKKYSNLIKKSRQPNILISINSTTQKHPKYLEFTITDLVGLTSALNAPENLALQSYLDNDSKYKIINSISVVATEVIYKDFLDAEEIYLTQHSANKLGLELMKGGKLYKTINFADFTPFNYNLSSFCWGKDNRNRPCIRAIVKSNTSCPKDTYKKAFKLEKKNEFKF